MEHGGKLLRSFDQQKHAVCPDEMRQDKRVDPRRVGRSVIVMMVIKGVVIVAQC